MEDVITFVLTLMVATTVLVMMDMFLEMIPPVVLVCVKHCVWLIVTVVIQISMNVKLIMEDVHKHVTTLLGLSTAHAGMGLSSLRTTTLVLVSVYCLVVMLSSTWSTVCVDYFVYKQQCTCAACTY